MIYDMQGRKLYPQVISTTTTTATSSPTILTTDRPFSMWDGNVSSEVSGGNQELKEKIDKLEKMFFRDVIVRCEHCGQWSAAYCACKHCGAPVNPKDE